MKPKPIALPLRDRCVDCGATGPTDDTDRCQACALKSLGLGLDPAEPYRGGHVQQVHAFGTADDQQSTLFE